MRCAYGGLPVVDERWTSSITVCLATAAQQFSRNQNGHTTGSALLAAQTMPMSTIRRYSDSRILLRNNSTQYPSPRSLPLPRLGLQALLKSLALGCYNPGKAAQTPLAFPEVSFKSPLDSSEDSAPFWHASAVTKRLGCRSLEAAILALPLLPSQ